VRQAAHVADVAVAAVVAACRICTTENIVAVAVVAAALSGPGILFHRLHGVRLLLMLILR
jgi:tetrahydromethanopterin S-methyltransferase subunit A